MPLNNDKIYLVGFMTAGKTTVARLLAARLDWRAEDVDALIEVRDAVLSMTLTEFGAMQPTSMVVPSRSNGKSCASCSPSVTSSSPPAGAPSWIRKASTR